MAHPSDNSSTDARNRLLDVAEKMFMESGFRGVRLKDISDALGVKPASLYYHAPGGKADLYLAVLERSMKKHRQGLTGAVEAAPLDAHARLIAAAEWLRSQPRMNIIRVSDELSWLEPAAQEKVRTLAYECVFVPLRALFIDCGLSDGKDANLLVGVFVASMDSVRAAEEAGFLRMSTEAATKRVVTLFSRGLGADPDP